MSKKCSAPTPWPHPTRIAISIALSLTIPEMASAQLARCNPLDIIRSGGVPSPYSIEELAVVQNQARIASNGDLSKLPPDFGVMQVRRNHQRCLLNGYALKDRIIMQKLLDAQTATNERAFGRNAVEFGVSFIPTPGELKVAKKVFDPIGFSFEKIPNDAKILLDQAITLAYADARANGDVATAAATYSRLRSEINSPSSPLFNGLSEDTKNQVLDMASRIFSDMAVSSPEALKTQAEQQKFIENLVGLVPPVGKQTIDSIQSKLRSPDSLPAEVRDAARALDKQIIGAKSEQETLAAKTQELIVKGQETGEALKDLADSATDRELWLEAQAFLDRPENSHIKTDPKALAKFSEARSAACGEVESHECKVYRLLKKDANARLKALSFSESAKDLATGAEVAAKAFAALGNEDASRFAGVISTTASKSAKIAATVAAASGPLGPLAWITIAGDLLDIGGSLGGFLGGNSGGADGAQAQLMTALQALSEQIADLRRLTLEGFAQQRRQTEVITAYSQLMVARLAADELQRGLGHCLEISYLLEAQGIASQQQFRALLDNKNTVAPSLLPTCANWLNDGQARVSAVTSKAIDPTFTLSDKLLTQAASSMAADSESSDALLAELRRVQSGHSALLRLATAATDKKGGLGLLIHPMDSVSRSLKIGIPGPAPAEAASSYPELGELLQKLGLPGFTTREHFRFRDTLGAALDADVIARILGVSLHVRNSMEGFTWDPSIQKIQSVIPDPADSLEQRTRKAQNIWLWYLAPLAYLSIAQETLYRGDVIVPLISELLEKKDQAATCQAKPIDSTSADLCTRFGKTALQALLEDAITAVRYFPHLRANVAIWRVSQALNLHKATQPDGQAYMPSYGIALAQRWSMPLSKLLPGVEPVWLPESPAKDQFIDDVSSGHRWFTPLTGDCAGLMDLSLNARAVCGTQGCDDSSVSQDKEGKWQIKTADSLIEPPVRGTQEWENWKALDGRICVLAPLPSQHVLESGKYISRVQFSQTLPIAQSFLTGAAYYFELQDRGNSPETIMNAIEMAAVLRPESVASPKFSTSGVR